HLFPFRLHVPPFTQPREKRFTMFFTFLRPLPPRSTLFPYTTLFRSVRCPAQHAATEDEAIGSELDDGALQHERDVARHAARIQKDRKSTRLNSSHQIISYAVFCLNKKRTAHPSVSKACSAIIGLPWR